MKFLVAGNSYTLFEARRGPWILLFFFFYSQFLLGAQISRYGLPTVFESMMWLLFLVGGGDVCRKGGKEEEEAVLQFSVLKL